LKQKYIPVVHSVPTYKKDKSYRT